MSAAAIDEPITIGHDVQRLSDAYVFDVEHEELFPLGSAPDRVKIVGQTGKKTHKATWFRRAKKPRLDVYGIYQVLPTVKFAGGLYTSIGAINWYVSRLTQAGAPSSSSAQGAAARSRSAERATRELDVVMGGR